jgi:threonine-phosphate decarboxylase
MRPLTTGDIALDGIFQIARKRGWDWREILDLSTNVNPLGPAPGVRGAIEQAIERIVHYPERSPLLLAERLAALWKVKPAQILLGNGATELIYFLARLWPFETVTLAAPTFPEFHQAYPAGAQVAWSSPRQWPRRGLLVLTQPNSLTGQTIAFERLSRWLIETNHPVLIEESFLDFTDVPSAMTLLAGRPNLFVLRSMSKFYGLPGLRIGALVGREDAISKLAERREPWQVGVLAEAAALASLSDPAYAERSRAFVAGEREWLWGQLHQFPTLTPIRGEANFYLVYLASGAADLCRWFLDRKVILRNCTGLPGLDGEAVRFAIRTRPENERVIAMLKEYLWRK